MAAQGGYGIACTIDVSGTPAALTGVLEMSAPEYEKLMAESTAHDAPSGYRTNEPTGKRQINNITGTLAWDTGQASHAAVVTAFAADTSVTFSWADPDGDETITLEVHVSKITRMSVQNDIFKADIEFTPTGPATIT